MDKKTQRVTITLPIDVYQKIKESAERDTRTIGEQITHLLKLHVPTYSNPDTPSTSVHYKKSIIG